MPKTLNDFAQGETVTVTGRIIQMSGRGLSPAYQSVGLQIRDGQRITVNVGCIDKIPPPEPEPEPQAPSLAEPLPEPVQPLTRDVPGPTDRRRTK